MDPHRPPRASAGPRGRPLDGTLAELARTAGVPVRAVELAALDRYVELLLEWNARINLTASRTPDEVVSAHFDDVFALATALADATRVVDFGSGGGLPAVPLAVVRRDLNITLVESIAKKAAFLRTAVRELALGPRVSVEGRRAEALAAAAPRSFDVAVSRAAMQPPAWLALAERLVRPGGRIFHFAFTDEVAAAAGLRVRARHAYAGGRRWLLELERST